MPDVVVLGSEGTETLLTIDGVAYRALRVNTSGELLVAVRQTASYTIGQTAVGVGTTTVFNATSARIHAAFVNDSDTAIYLALGQAAVVGQGIRLNANGGSFEITQQNPWTGAVNAISTAAAKNLAWIEGVT